MQKVGWIRLLRSGNDTWINKEITMVTEKLLREKLELVIDKLMNLGQRTASERLDTEDDRTAAFNRRDSGIAIWDWPQGVGLYGFQKIMKMDGNDKYVDFLHNWYKARMEEGLPVRNINTTAPLLTLVGLIDEAHPEYEALALSWVKWIMEELPRTQEGGFEHVTSGDEEGKTVHRNPEQMWVDTLFMAVLFLNKMAQKYDVQAWRDEAEYQVLQHIKYLFDTSTGLLFHGWTFEKRNNFGGVRWNRGDSWFTVVIPDYLEDCGEHISPAVRRSAVEAFRAQCTALRKIQAEDGLWHTVLTNPDTYEETSGTAAIAAGMLKGIRLGILDESFRETALKAVEGIVNNIAEDGTVKNVSAGTAVGMDETHYQNIMIAPMAYGQSLTILALCEALMLLK